MIYAWGTMGEKMGTRSKELIDLDLEIDKLRWEMQKLQLQVDALVRKRAVLLAKMTESPETDDESGS
jgi:hypothetical protein